MQRKHIITAILLPLLLLPVLINMTEAEPATPTLQWSKTYPRPPTTMFDRNTTHYDSGSCFVQTSDGGYAIVGRTDDYLYVGPHGAWYHNYSSLFIKTDAAGNVQWQNNSGFSDMAIFQTNDSGYLLIPSRFFLIKLDSEGNLVWNKTLGMVLSGAEQTRDGDYIFVATSGKTAIMAKTDADGNLLWNKTLYSFQNPFLDDIKISNIAPASGGSYYIAGWSSTFSSAIGKGDPNLWLLKVDSDGNLLFSKSYSYDPNAGIDPNPAAIGTIFVAPTDDGGCILDGTVGFPFLVKLASNGDWQWNRSYPDGVTTRASFSSIIQTVDGGYVAVGGYPDTGNFKALIVEMDADGNLVWNQTFDSSVDLAEASSIIKTSDGAAVVLGSLNGDVWLAKLNVPTQESTTGPSNNSDNSFIVAIIAVVIVSVSVVITGVLIYYKKRSPKSGSITFAG